MKIARSVDDREVWACADQLLRQYGEGAHDHALSRVAELRAAGDGDGERVWTSIAYRILQLSAPVPVSSMQ